MRDKPASATVPPASIKEGKIDMTLFERAISRIYFEATKNQVNFNPASHPARSRHPSVWAGLTLLTFE
jgi:hypothetical protein